MENMRKRAEEWATHNERRVKALSQRLGQMEKDKLMAESRAGAVSMSFNAQQRAFMTTLLDVTVPEEN